jgi:hypothetical protein
MTTTLDSGSLPGAIVIENQRSIIALERAQAAIQTCEQTFIVRGIAGVGHGIARPLANIHIPNTAHLGITQVLEQNEFRSDVAVAGRRGVRDAPFLFEPPGHTVQRFVGKIVGRTAALPLEVQHQATAHLQIGLTARVVPFIEPREQALECLGRGDPVAFQWRGDASTPGCPEFYLRTERRRTGPLVYFSLIATSPSA